MLPMSAAVAAREEPGGIDALSGSWLWLNLKRAPAHVDVADCCDVFGADIGIAICGYHSGLKFSLLTKCDAAPTAAGAGFPISHGHGRQHFSSLKSRHFTEKDYFERAGPLKVIYRRPRTE
jgi:hypothetical protein